MNKDEVDKFCKEYYGYTIEESDKDIGYWMEKNYELQKENNQLKEQLEKKYEKIGTLTSEILYEENTKLQSVLKELRSWLEEEIKQRSKYDRWAFEDTLDKLNELSGEEK